MAYRYSAENWPQFSALLDTILELPTEQRLSWIDSLATESPATKARLCEFLTTTIGVDEILHKPPNFSAAFLEEAQGFQQIQIELQPDRLIGVYRLVRELGQGGMGSVWLAQRVDGKFKRDVALKFPYAGPRQRQLAERLLREREILGSLQHANIARLYDADVTASGQPFLVLEYIEGVAINRYCDQQRLDIRARLLLFQQVLSAVRYAHVHLVIHRDLKPSNILITDDGIVHLLDFGIAASITDGAAHETPLTRFGGYMLTPEYASPEQVARATLTTASDIYTVGVVLYELLTGTLPYPRQREQRAQLEQAITTADVVIPSRAAISDEAAACRHTRPDQLRKALRGELDTLLMKALKTQPDERYASADAFADDVVRYLENKPILAQPDSQWYRTRKFAQRNRVVVGSFVAIVMAMMVGTGIALWQAHVAAQQRDRAVSLATRGEAITEFMRIMVTEIADADEPITIETLLTRAEESATNKFSVNVDQRIAVLEMLGGYYKDLQLTNSAKQSFTKALELAENGSDNDLKARLNCKVGGMFMWMGDNDKAQQYIEVGLKLSKDQPELNAQCLRTQAVIEYGKADIYGALRDLNMATDELQNITLNDPDLPGDIQDSKAQDEMEIGQVAAAKRSLNLALQRETESGRAERSYLKFLLENLSLAETYAGNPKGALLYLDRAAEILRKFNPDKTKTLYANSYAVQYYTLGRYAEALQLYREGLEFSKKNHDATVIYSTLGIAKIELALGHLAKAEQQAHELEVMMDGNVRAVDGINAQNFLELKAMLAIANRNYDAAVTFTSENIDYLSSHKMLSTPLVTNLNLRGEAYLGNGNITAALTDATQAYDISRSVQDDMKYSRFSGEAALLLAKIETKRNQSEAARKWAAIAYQQLQGSLGNEHPTTIEAKQLLDSVQISH